MSLTDLSRDSLQLLEQFIAQLGYELNYVEMIGKGGIALYSGRKRFMISVFLTPEEKISVICGELKKMDLENTYLVPRLRKLIYGEDDL
jgi:hypothetical protein